MCILRCHPGPCGRGRVRASRGPCRVLDPCPYRARGRGPSHGLCPCRDRGLCPCCGPSRRGPCPVPSPHGPSRGPSRPGPCPVPSRRGPCPVLSRPGPCRGPFHHGLSHGLCLGSFRRDRGPSRGPSRGRRDSSRRDRDRRPLSSLFLSISPVLRGELLRRHLRELFERIHRCQPEEEHKWVAVELTIVSNRLEGIFQPFY